MPIQISLTVLGQPAHATPPEAEPGRGGAPAAEPAAEGVDVQITAPADTPLSAVLGPLAQVAAPGAGAPGAVFCEDRRLHPHEALLGQPPLVDGAVLAFHRPVVEALEPAAPARLLVVAGPDAGGVHLLRGGEARIGRSAEADVPLDDPDVSRLHCAVAVDAAGAVTVTDLQSTNGTLLGGAPVRGGPVPVPPGAVLRLGESALRVVAGRAAPPLPPAPPPPPPASPDAPTSTGVPALPAPRSGASGSSGAPGAPGTAGTAGAPPVPSGPAPRRPGRSGLAPWARLRGAAEAGPAPGPPVEPPVARGAEAESAVEPPWPDPAHVLLAAVEAGPGLWQRDAAHPECGAVRLGTAPSAGGPLRPVALRLPEVGSLGLAGPRPRVAGLARNVLAQLAALHPPSALELMAVAPGGAAAWSWLGWLPHLRPTRGQECRLLLGFDREQAAARVRELTERLRAPAGAPARRTVLLVDGDPGTPELRADLARLAAEGPAVGIHLLCLVETEPATPASPVAATLAAARESSPAFAACPTVGLLSGAVATALRLVGPEGPSPVAIADAVSTAWAERLARALAPRREAAPAAAEPAAASALPDSCRLLDALELPRVTPGTLRERWSAPGGGLPVVLGAGAEGRPFALDLAQAAGPAFVAGGPGSGRTELLCALAAALAVARAPRELSLLLVEGAGEGLGPCAELPHVASRLRSTDPVRMREFAQALRAELKRRAALLGDAAFGGVRQRAGRVVAPRAEGGREGPAPAPGGPPMLVPGSGPLPRLVVLVDDVDALLAPPLGAPGRQAAGSVVRALEAVAAEGPRLGVHLVTAGAAGAAPAEHWAATRVALSGQPAGRATLHRAGATPVEYQVGRVTGRIPRTATLRPTVTPLSWARAGDPPSGRPVRELGNGPTDVALLASAAARAAQSDRAATATLV